MFYLVDIYLSEMQLGESRCWVLAIDDVYDNEEDDDLWAYFWAWLVRAVWQCLCILWT